MDGEKQLLCIVATVEQFGTDVYAETAKNVSE